jgi:hypothetical protein
MTLAELDDTLQRLRGDADAIGSNLVELDTDPNRKLLEHATLTGESGQRWDDASRALANMWVLLARFTALLDQAAELRGTRARLNPSQEQQLETLLTGQSIELERAEIPLPVRSATGGREASTRCTPDELVRAISDAFERVKSVIFGIGTVWDTMIPRLRAAQTAVSGAANETRALGDEPDAALQNLETRVEQLGDVIALDPLAADPSALDEIEGEVAGLRVEIGAASALREEVTARMDAARVLLAELVDAGTTAAEAHREVTEKIVSPPVPTPTPVGRDIEAEYDRIVTMTHDGKWRTAQPALDDWTTEATTTLEAVRACITATRAPLEERNELRGRLDAYHALAHARGLIEDPAASAQYDEAHDALYTAPTDLAGAAALVRAYREAINAHPRDRKGRM